MNDYKNHKLVNTNKNSSTQIFSHAPINHYQFDTTNIRFEYHSHYTNRHMRREKRIFLHVQLKPQCRTIKLTVAHKRNAFVRVRVYFFTYL